MKTRLLVLTLALALTLSLLPPALAADTGYTDIPQGHWSAESVRRATELGLFQGVGGGQFGRGQSITRAAFVTALVRLFGWEAVSPPQPTFTDVGRERWFYTAVETACANGAVLSAERAFRPTDSITREEMAVMLVRALGYSTLAQSLSSLALPFTDVKSNTGYIAIAYDIGMITGVTASDGSLRFLPHNSAKREEAAAMLEQLRLEEVAKSRARILSGGWQRRLSIAMALISEPEILFLDEPTLGLDVLARRELWHVIEGLKGRTTVILTTHYLEEAEALAHRIGIMAAGRLRAVGTPEELKALAGAHTFEDAFVSLAAGKDVA